MTVSELIAVLKGHPPDLRVVVNGYENGFDALSPDQISLVRIALNTGVEAYEGQHGYDLIGNLLPAAESPRPSLTR